VVTSQLHGIHKDIPQNYLEIRKSLSITLFPSLDQIEKKARYYLESTTNEFKMNQDTNLQVSHTKLHNLFSCATI
jgi:hypothetical protein